MNSFERQLSDKFSSIDLKEITPGVMVDVYSRGRRKGLLAVGKTYDFYDLASLTKILFTASAAIQYFSENPKELKRPVKEVLPWWRSRQTTPARLMTHTAGLEWWKPYYQELKGPMRPEVRWPQLLEMLAELKPARSTKAVYSDPDLWMTGAFLSMQTQKSLLELWLQTKDDLRLKELFFHPGNQPKFARNRYAPTEKCGWRKKTLQGEVHDENCWALAGVAPHAGLFGSIEGVSDWGLKLRRAFLDQKTGFRDNTMVRRFVRRQVPRRIGDWGYCFMKPSKGKTSCGRYFSLESFGHTGFTGTSLWYDPKKDLLVVILSNRVHPTRENARFVALRPQIHEWICELL